jgi:DNA-binding NtrC family response regulator
MRVARERAGGSAPTVLHLDDDRDTLEITARILGDQVRLLPATTVGQARAILDRETPDIAILDLQLEHGSGLDLLPALIDAEGQAIPTIIYSAQQVSAEAARMVDAVLVKTPGSLPNLRTTIRRIAERRKGRGGG